MAITAWSAQIRGAAAENCAAVEDTGHAAPTSTFQFDFEGLAAD
jgi:hypothetical protein